jgi:hypothetical protein
MQDGYKAAEICDAMLRSATNHHREELTYRS